MDSKKYCQIIEDEIVPIFKNNSRKKFIFQQDNVRIHTSKYSENFFEKNEIPLLYWPPYSPDLNPIENVWGELFRRVYKKNSFFKSIDDLKNSLTFEWENLEKKYLENLINSMESRLIQVIKRDGDFTDY